MSIPARILRDDDSEAARAWSAARAALRNSKTNLGERGPKVCRPQAGQIESRHHGCGGFPTSMAERRSASCAQATVQGTYHPVDRPDTDSDNILGLESATTTMWRALPILRLCWRGNSRPAAHSLSARRDACSNRPRYVFARAQALAHSRKGTRFASPRGGPTILRYLLRPARGGIARDAAAGSVGYKSGVTP